MFAKLASYAGMGSSLPFTVDSAAPYDESWGGWTHSKGTLKHDSSEVSIFKKSAAPGRELDAARNGVKRLRTMRHPNIVAFRETAEVEEKGATTIYLVTEPVKPLTVVLNELNLEGTQREQYFTMGLYHVAGAVSFLNNTAGMIHGNVCMATVVVTPSLDWKLHGLDLLSEHSMSEQPPPLSAANWMVSGHYIPGEVGKSDWDTIAAGPPYAVDAWGTGCLLHEVYASKPLSQIEELRDTSCIPDGLLKDYQRLLSSQPTRRLNPEKLVSESGFLKNSLVKTVAFLENLSVKDSAEKDQFFRKLPNLLTSFPQPVCVNKFLPLLQEALSYGGAPPIALSAVLQIGNTLAPDEFQARIIPIITHLFTSQERAIRKSLLENIELFGPHMSEKVCEEQIFPEVAKGFTDSNDYLRELTLRSMLTLAPKLSQRTLNNQLLKYLAKLQVDEKPGIRANTTVLLGNIAEYLGDAACKRVLLNAFTRALKDQFPPARIAALKALLMTADKHSPEEAAARIMPSVIAFTVDPVKDVRQAALQCNDTYLRKIKKHVAELNKRDEAAEAAAAAAGTVVQQGASVGSSISQASSFSALGKDEEKGGYLSWAAGLVGTSSNTAATTAPSPATSASAEQNATSSEISGASAIVATESSKEVDGDGWDDDDEDLEGLDEAEDEAEREARERMERLKKKPIAKPGKPVAIKSKQQEETFHDAYENGDDGWGDEDDDPLDDMLAEARANFKPSKPSRPTSAKPKVSSLGAKPKSKPMKLGAQKLSKPAEDEEW